MLDQIQKRLQIPTAQNRERKNLPINPQAQKISELVQSIKNKGNKK